MDKELVDIFANSADNLKQISELMEPAREIAELAHKAMEPMQKTFDMMYENVKSSQQTISSVRNSLKPYSKVAESMKKVMPTELFIAELAKPTFDFLNIDFIRSYAKANDFLQHVTSEIQPLPAVRQNYLDLWQNLQEFAKTMAKKKEEAFAQVSQTRQQLDSLRNVPLYQPDYPALQLPQPYNINIIVKLPNSCNE